MPIDFAMRALEIADNLNRHFHIHRPSLSGWMGRDQHADFGSEGQR